MFRIWWIPDVPGPAFTRSASSLAECKKLLNMIVDYTRYLEGRKLCFAYSADVGGIQVYEDGEWVDASLVCDDESDWDYTSSEDADA